MIMLPDKEDRKVEYVELIYDLIFVYLVSRNGSLLHSIVDGFIPLSNYITFLASTLIVLQIWYLSALYMNQYGDGSLREHLMLFFNMYLLYYMADGIRNDWGAWYFQYNIAWALILLNLAFQYFRMGKTSVLEENRKHRSLHALLLVIEAGIVLISIPIYAMTGVALAPWALVFGTASLWLSRKVDMGQRVDFPHLSERVMLYVVFTFGEMVLGISGYFDEGFSLMAVYFSLMAFSIVVGLFSAYGHFYNHLLNRDLETGGQGYMLLHIVLILALSNITAAMELMQRSYVHAAPKTVFLTLSILVFYICLLFTQRYAAKRIAAGRTFYWKFGLCCGLYCLGTVLCYRWPAASIALSAMFIYLQLYALHFGKKV